MILLDALDVLGLALADHGHKWSDYERGLYEAAVSMLTSSYHTDADLLASRKCQAVKRERKAKSPPTTGYNVLPKKNNQP